MMDIVHVLDSLHKYCKGQDYKGFDVGDGINSPFLTKTILGKIPFARLVFGQLTGHHYSIFNLRPFLLVPKYYNAKGIALFLNGYCNFYEILGERSLIEFNKKDSLSTIVLLADRLVSLRNKGRDYYGWGYPGGWQGRLDFYWPENTPTAVASSFAVDALFHAFDITNNEKYKQAALDTSKFILHDLRRTPYKDGFFFSYSALNGMDGVYNASLLAARILIQCYKYTGDVELRQIAREAIDTVVADQNEDGSWYYGIKSNQKWIDNFHTGYNLEAISEYKQITGENIYDECLHKGLEFYLKNHFDENGIPKYYHNRQYPIDIHCCGEIYPVLYKLDLFIENETLADNVFRWTIGNMYDPNKGYFYFQKKIHTTIKVPLMRWSEAFMMNALSYYLKSKVYK